MSLRVHDATVERTHDRASAERFLPLLDRRRLRWATTYLSMASLECSARRAEIGRFPSANQRDDMIWTERQTETEAEAEAETETEMGSNRRLTPPSADIHSSFRICTSGLLFVPSGH